MKILLKYISTCMRTGPNKAAHKNIIRKASENIFVCQYSSYKPHLN